MQKTSLLTVCLALALAPFQAGCAEPVTCHIKAMVVQPTGAPVRDLTLQDWTLKVDGKPVPLTAALSPAEVSHRPVQWAFVLLPMQDPKVRKLALTAITGFLKNLPPSDSLLLVMQGEKGLECLTPGFTTRRSLWASALARAAATGMAGLHDCDRTFTLPPSPPKEPPAPGDGPEALKAFAATLDTLEFKRLTADVRSKRFFENYVEGNAIRGVPESEYHLLRGYTTLVEEATDALEGLATTLGKVPGEKQIIVFSRNEIDDLGNPVWQQRASKIAVSDMTGRVDKARDKVKQAFARQGLTLHAVVFEGLGYQGAFGEAAKATGGWIFLFKEDLQDRLPMFLSAWTARYDLSFTLPAEPARPVDLDLGLNRQGLKIFAPKVH